MSRWGSQHMFRMKLRRLVTRVCASAAVVAGLVFGATVDPASAQRGPPGPERFSPERFGPDRSGPFNPDRWEELDVQEVSRRDDRIVMPVGRREGQHSAIRLRVLDAPLAVDRVTVIYSNGTSTEIPIRRVMSEGDVTPPIDLEGNLRFIREVHVEFRPQTGDRDWREQNWRDRGPRGGGGRGSRVQLLGDKVENRAPPPPAYGSRDVPPGWISFGSKQADFDGDRDIIRVGRDKGRFDKIAVRVRDNDVFMRDIRVVYENGEQQDFPVNQVVRAGYRTTEFNLRGDRYISEIMMFYSSRPTGNIRATVEVFGEYVEDFARERTRPDNNEWIVVASKSISSMRTDNDVFPIGERFGAVKRLRLTVRNTPVRIDSVTVNFANGEQEILPVNRELGPGESSPSLEFRGRGRRVSAIGIAAKSKFSLKGEGAIEIWAQH